VVFELRSFGAAVLRTDITLERIGDVDARTSPLKARKRFVEDITRKGPTKGARALISSLPGASPTIMWLHRAGFLFPHTRTGKLVIGSSSRSPARLHPRRRACTCAPSSRGRHGPRPRRSAPKARRPGAARDAAVLQVVRRERWYAGRGAAARKRSTKAVGPKPWKTGRSGMRSSRATSAQTASKSTSGTWTHRARPVSPRPSRRASVRAARRGRPRRAPRARPAIPCGA